MQKDEFIFNGNQVNRKLSEQLSLEQIADMIASLPVNSRESNILNSEIQRRVAKAQIASANSQLLNAKYMLFSVFAVLVVGVAQVFIGILK